MSPSAPVPAHDPFCDLHAAPGRGMQVTERGESPAPAAPGTPAWRELMAGASDALTAAGFDNATQEARWLVERAGGFEPGELHLALDGPATVRSATYLRHMLERRLGGEPLQYVLGRWSFRTLDLLVDSRVLIP
ncbi:MAG TPA: hypothetical protein VGJ86_11205, partial [Acidimicrobiales bacterium]